MSKNKTFSILGGDLRQVHLANTLAKAGYTVSALYFNEAVEFEGQVLQPEHPAQAVSRSDVLILPLPVTLDHVHLNAAFCSHKVRLDDCLEPMRNDAFLFGGMIPPEIYDLCAQRGVTASDYMQREELAVRNAVPTAEGAIGIAMQELPTTLFGRRCLLVGYGRIARVLLPVLLAMGVQVTVAARRCSDLAWIGIAGGQAVPISQLAQAAQNVDLIFNTVPSPLLGRPALEQLKPGALVIDLASKPGGVDLEAAQKLGIRTIWALSLPGKVAPLSAGEIIKDTILNILQERGEL